MKTSDPIILSDHIGKYLAEAGFSTTEIVVLKRMLNGEPFTLRELAKKTGKSTGVLDQAMKKLIHKTILEKKAINGTPKYSLDSSDSIMRWMKRDMKEKWESMQRKKSDFESFVSSIQHGQSHPVIEYYEGAEGLEKAYDQLLKAGDELLQLFPYTSKTEKENPLKKFRADFITRRRGIGMFSRVITHDTALGRRYQSRDPFEFRKTILVPEKEYSFSYEKAIAGDIVVCFNQEENRACLIRFPELAHAERYTFEVIWGLMMHKDLESDNASPQKIMTDNEGGALLEEKNRFLTFLSLAPRIIREGMKYLHIIPRNQIANRDALHLRFEVFCKDRIGVIHDLSRPFAMRNTNISRFDVFAVPHGGAMYEICFEAKSMEEASYIIDELQRIPGVMSVTQSKKRKQKTPEPESDMVEVPA